MAAPEVVRVRKRCGGRVWVLQLNRPERLNALDTASYAQLAAALRGASEDARVDAVLLCGRGRFFCSGTDLYDDAPARVHIRDGASAAFIRELIAFEKLLICSVHGPAVGIATTLLFHCDLVYATPQATFSTPFSRIAMVPECAASVAMPARIGHQRAMAMLLLGKEVTAAEAKAMGFVTDVWEARRGAMDGPEAAAAWLEDRAVRELEAGILQSPHASESMRLYKQMLRQPLVGRLAGAADREFGVLESRRLHIREAIERMRAKL